MQIASLEPPKSIYLLIILDANECTIAYLYGKRIIKLWERQSYIQGKHGAGGQSQRRFERGREEALKQWFSKIAEKLKDIYYHPRMV